MKSSNPAASQTVNKTALKTITAAERRLNHTSLINLVCLSDHECVCAHIHACVFSLCVLSFVCIHVGLSVCVPAVAFIKDVPVAWPPATQGLM